MSLHPPITIIVRLNARYTNRNIVQVWHDRVHEAPGLKGSLSTELMDMRSRIPFRDTCFLTALVCGVIDVAELTQDAALTAQAPCVEHFAPTPAVYVLS